MSHSVCVYACNGVQQLEFLAPAPQGLYTRHW